MSQYDQHQQPAAYPEPPTSYPPPPAYVMAPPPMGYPTRDDNHQDHATIQTTSRGGGFFKGCLAGLCCCWCLDCCF
ncbi:protein CYSTEINE-RICH TRANSMEMBRANE MODULE 3-like [Salvia hispanica]|uniref:protein CYSTEINE-RICH TRANSMEMBRANE MODULE 3-like n=1 Tax=Salvia hispanica TaxID=49212 RepID=UPI002009086F|nr:protein CYSTEINE-RICH TRANSMEMBRANE MODULE 3-like [Salvia hispanica]